MTGVKLANVTGQQVIEAHKVLARTFGLLPLDNTSGDFRGCVRAVRCVRGRE
jgi:hypothetical protein